MTFLEAVKMSRDSGGGLWFRPASHQGPAGRACLVKGSYVCVAPTPRGAKPALVSVDLILDQWETVTPEELAAEIAPLLHVTEPGVS